MNIELIVKRNGETLCNETITKNVMHEFALFAIAKAVKQVPVVPVKPARMFSSQNG